MADNVTGQIGADQVYLENAATEATLRLLLAATLATTKEQRKAIQDLVQKAGLDPTKVEAANEGLTTLGTAAVKVESVLTVASNQISKVFEETSRIVGQFTAGTMQASGIFGEFVKIGGPVGLVASGLQKVAQFQEAQLVTYQDITRAGVNFSGSLTEMRVSAAQMNLTMGEFTNLIKNNGDAFARMGGTADDGFKNFKKVSTELVNSEAGDKLRALGLTSEQVNQGLATYISTTGGRSRKEMENTAALTASATAYMQELDALAEATGKTKDEQIAAGKEAAANQAWQAHLGTLTEEQKAKAEIARAEALARGGKGAEQALMSAAMGFPPMTKAAQEYTAMAGNASRVTRDQAAAIKDNTKTVDDMKRGGAAYNAALVTDAKNLGVAGNAIIMQGGSMAGTASAIIGASNRIIKQGTDKAGEAEKQLDEINKRREEREKSQADGAAKTQTALKVLGAVIMDKIIGPISALLMPVINGLIQGISFLLVGLAKVPLAFEALSAVVAAVTLKYIYQKAAMMVNSAKGTGSKVLDILPGGGDNGTIGRQRDAKGKFVKAGVNKGGALGGIVGGAAGGGGMLEGLGAGIKSIGSALAGLGPQAPMILAGAAAVGGAIVLVGAGIAGATWLLGKALPSLAEGLTSFSEIDGVNLIKVGAGVAALGAGLAVFGAGGVMSSVGGAVSGLVDSLGGLVGVKSPVEKLKDFAALGPGLEQSGKGMQAFTTNMNALLNTDLSKISKLTEELAKLKAASAPAEKGVVATVGDVLKTAVGGGKEGGGSSESLTKELQTLNKQTADLLRVMRESANSTEKTASILAARGNLFRS